MKRGGGGGGVLFPEFREKRRKGDENAEKGKKEPIFRQRARVKKKSRETVLPSFFVKLDTPFNSSPSFRCIRWGKKNM